MRRIFTFTLHHFYSLLFFLTLSLPGLSQSGGTVSGVIKDSDYNEGLPGARIYLEGTKLGAMTDPDGSYSISKIPQGSYNIIFESFGYLSDTLKNVSVSEGQTLTFDRTLEPEIAEGEIVEIIIERNTGSDIHVMEEKKTSDQVTEVIGSREIGRTAASNTADVAKRVPGITIQEGRFVIVRGLSQRYNAVMLNNALAPSSEADIKAFSFDIIPSAMIDRMVIYKTGAPELPGEFAGGVIKIFTKNMPDRTSLRVSYTAGFRQYTTSQGFREQVQGDKFFLGFDDGTYSVDNIPGSMPNSTITAGNRNELIGINGLLNNSVFLPQSGKAPVDARLSLNFSGKLDLGKKARLGTETIVNYSNTYSRMEIFRGGYNKYIREYAKVDTLYVDYDTQYSHAVNLGVLHNWALKIDDKHLVEFKNLFNQLGNSVYTFREEIYKEGLGFYRNDHFLRNLFRTMYSGQLSGSHELKSIRTKVEWTGGYSSALRDAPDFRRYRQQRKLTTPNAPLTTVVQQNVNPFFLGRLYSKTDEDVWMASANVEHRLKFTWGDSLRPLLRTGFYAENKERDFRVRNLGYRSNGNENALGRLPLEELFSPATFSSHTGLFIGELSNPSYSYGAGNRLIAYYLGVEVPVSKRLSIYPGLRVENNRQTLNSFDSETGDPVNVFNPIVRYLPSVNITYALKPDTALIRLAYAETLNRPEFREIAPLNYFDFDLNQSVMGNPKLLTPKIHNYDARYEYYPRAGETNSIGVFYKRFINPIETYFVESSNPVITYNNAKFARSIGVEVEVKKSMMGVFDFRGLENFSVALNGALINSKIDIGQSAIQSAQRQMQGQSPYIVNGAIYYNNAKLGWQVNAIYNIIGRRIFLVGNTQGYPDVYEMPRHALDLTSSVSIGRFLEARVTVQNVFNQKFLFVQDANEDGRFEREAVNDQVIIGYKTGRYITVGLTGKF